MCSNLLRRNYRNGNLLDCGLAQNEFIKAIIYRLNCVDYRHIP